MRDSGCALYFNPPLLILAPMYYYELCPSSKYTIPLKRISERAAQKVLKGLHELGNVTYENPSRVFFPNAHPRQYMQEGLDKQMVSIYQNKPFFFSWAEENRFILGFIPFTFKN